MAELSIKNINKRFGETEVLKGVSLDIADGEFVSLVGPSGCGKSTLLRIIAGLEAQSSGDIRIDGRSVGGRRAADRNLSMVFQSYALYPHLSVGENIAVPLKMRRMNGLQRLPVLGGLIPGQANKSAEISAEVAQAAQMLEISHLLDRKPGQLSGGQRQRVALGRALVRDPAAFLLDEPLSNLDAKLRVQTRAEIAQLHRRLDATFIYVTHDQVEAMTMSDRIAVMMGGRILQCATPETVYDDPDRVEVAEFIGSPKINLLPVELRETGQVDLFGKALDLTTTRRARGVASLGLRPEALFLAAEGAPIRGRITHRENLGSEMFIQIEVAGLEPRVTFRAGPEKRASLEIGSMVDLDFDTAKALVFDATGARVRDVSPTRVSKAEVA
ncbi:sugar ABC transporter, ATP-binding protein [Roseobacter sp. MED193]|uniref:ABC transporter ATP-binding protein n=1 Tax=Roseobacter sp. MED193 TaxID=314262 RepID=UPI000068A34C|nr:ABC transporter ATP-binding protein [Roseobacter sp. MED193]EAQ44574.1 sugar ABC transporter, ATP-binding protein [Roseobacter sp. MED193]